MDTQRLEQIIAGYELTTPGKWVIHYPQSRSKPQIVLVGKDDYPEAWVAQAFSRDTQARDDILFACNAHQDIPELVSEVERLQAIDREFEALQGELRKLFGSNFREGIRQFKLLVVESSQ